MNRIEIIVEKLSKHELSKVDAVNMLQALFDEQRKKEAVEFEVEEVSFSVENNHGFIKAKVPYGYSKIENKIKKGSKVDISVVY